MRILFRAAAGPATGFGHLVRCRSIARALGVIPAVSIRGSSETRATAAARGFDVRNGGVALLRGTSRPDVLVIDDPSAEQAARWVNRAREAGVPVVTMHDAGLAYTDSDLAIDGSIAPHADDPRLTLAGPTYAALDPSIAAARSASPRVRAGVLVALGGGEAVQQWGLALAGAVLERYPTTRVRVAVGFTHTPAPTADARIVWVCAPYGLADELRQAEVAVVGGGVTLYEAAALAAPAVAVAVVPGQQAAIDGFASRRAAVDGGLLFDASSISVVADHVARLLVRPAHARRLGQAGARIVDGRGVFRVADAVSRLARRSGERTHAA
jgi:spore coat polysaccharide biosynthesis predicted glycosyltransferase SpsG